MTVKELKQQLEHIPDHVIVYIKDSGKPLSLILEHTGRGRKILDDGYPTQFITIQ